MKSTAWIFFVALAALVALLAVGCSDNSTGGGTTPQGPGAPSLSVPAEGATGVALNPTTFRWYTSARAVDYILQVSTDAGFANKIVDQNVNADTTYNTTALGYHTVYHWRVEARDSSGLSSFSVARSFTTVGALMASWDATTAWRDSLGVDQMRYTFTADSNYVWFYSFGTTSITRSGGFSATSNQIAFHETLNDGVPVDTTYTRTYSLVTPYNRLTLEYHEGSTDFMVEYDRVP